MITLIQAIFFIIICLIIFTIYWYWTIPQNMPPGPLGLPLLGSTLDFLYGPHEHVKLQEYAKKYGPLFKLYIGNKLVIVLGDYDIIQEALVKNGDAFTGRLQFLDLIPGFNQCGLLFSEGETWKVQRRFALSTLRDFGFGRPILEPRIREEIDCLNERIDEFAKTGKPFNPDRLLLCAVANVISFLVFGRRFDYDNEEFMSRFLALIKLASDNSTGTLSPFLLCKEFASLFKDLPLPFIRMFKDVVLSCVAYTEKEIEKTKSTFDPESEPTNYVHAFMKAALEKKGKSFNDDMQLLASASDLFAAGSGTTSNTIGWAILYLAHHPDLQEKMHKEIKYQFGTALPSYGDRTKLPFCEAVIMETQRACNLIPVGVPRRTVEPVKLMGFDIPENAIVIPLLSNVMHNPDFYPDPKQFDPLRFLDENGKIIRDPKLIPFQAGKRACLGEPMARMELFLFLVSLVSRYRFYFRDDKPKPTLEPRVGFNCFPVPYEVYVEHWDG